MKISKDLAEVSLIKCVFRVKSPQKATFKKMKKRYNTEK